MAIPALHLALIKQIATTHTLPSSLPHLAARVGEGGTIEAAFPYAYTPLYHLVGAVMYSMAGVDGVLLINGVGAAAIAYVIFRFSRRSIPWPAAALSAFAAFASPRVQGPFAGIFMEPLTLGLLFGGAWFTYAALASRRPGLAAVAGTLLGLSIGARQSALLYVGVISVVVLWSLCARGAWRPARLRRELCWLATFGGAIVVVAAPSLIFLAVHNGGIGYADLTIPGTGNGPAIDPAANAYVSSITKPSAPVAAWLSRYSRTLLYGDMTLPTWTQLFVVIPAIAGVMHLEARGGASRFFARWISLQVVAEIFVFVTMHGNARYIILSQMLFFCAAPVGAYAIGTWALARAATKSRFRGPLACTPIILLVGMGVAMFPPGYFDVFTGWVDRDYRTFRGRHVRRHGSVGQREHASRLHCF